MKPPTTKTLLPYVNSHLLGPNDKKWTSERFRLDEFGHVQGLPTNYRGKWEGGVLVVAATDYVRPEGELCMSMRCESWDGLLAGGGGLWRINTTAAKTLVVPAVSLCAVCLCCGACVEAQELTSSAAHRRTPAVAP
jgi:hypothetical protein